MKKTYTQIINLIIKAHRLALSIGIPNMLQPGLIKEMIIANQLEHGLIISKRDSDAHSLNDSKIKYEYLSCKEGGTGQLDRMFNLPDSKRQQSLERIRRNNKIYLAIFYENNQMEIKIIYEIEPFVLEKEAIAQLDRSKNDISHVGFSENWAKRNGMVVYVANR